MNEVIPFLAHHHPILPILRDDSTPHFFEMKPDSGERSRSFHQTCLSVQRSMSLPINLAIPDGGAYTPIGPIQEDEIDKAWKALLALDQNPSQPPSTYTFIYDSAYQLKDRPEEYYAFASYHAQKQHDEQHSCDYNSAPKGCTYPARADFLTRRAEWEEGKWIAVCAACKEYFEAKYPDRVYEYKPNDMTP